MVARDLISHDIAPLSPALTGREALQRLNESHVKHLPLVEEGRLLGIVSEEDIFNASLGEPIGAASRSNKLVAALENDHALELMRAMGENRMTAMPVIGAGGAYLGLVLQYDLIRYFASTISVAEPGAVLELEMGRHDYSLAKVARLVEAEGALILSAFVSSSPDAQDLQATIKLNRHDVGGIAAALERHGYSVKEFHAESESDSTLRERYDSLMRYLDV